MHPLVKETLVYAEKASGIREVGDNGGPEVTQYLKTTGLGPGNPWCMAFCFAKHQQAAKFLSLPTVIPCTASCEVARVYARERGWLRDYPSVGDLMLRVGKIAGEFRAHHAGLVLTVTHDTFHTVEGNTNNWGGREGVGVFELGHAVSSAYVFAHWELGCSAPGVPWRLVDTKGRDMQVPIIQLSGAILAGIRALGTVVGCKVGWVPEKQCATYNGGEVPVQISWSNGSTFAPITELAHALGLTAQVDEQDHIIRLSRGAKP